MDDLLNLLKECKETLSAAEYAALWYMIMRKFKAAGIEPSDELCDSVVAVYARALEGDLDEFEAAIAEVDAFFERQHALEKQQSGGYHAPLTFWQMRHLPVLVSIHQR
jgi:hypothetical protein